jgi:predicted component of type VI protein secretion system
MEEKIGLEEFLKEMIAAINRKFERQGQDIEKLRVLLEKFGEINGKNEQETALLKDKIKDLESALNSLKARWELDLSLLKVLEG